MKHVRVTYIAKDGLDEKLDAKITAALTLAGFSWYAQGFNLETEVRDICFDVPIIKDSKETNKTLLSGVF